MVDSFEDFKTLIHNYGIGNRKQKLLYLLILPDNVEWDYGVYRQAQMTYMQMSGGPTGAGTGNNLVLCLQSEVEDKLKEFPNYTHAMICAVGMIFVVTKISKGIARTGLNSFLEFTKSGEYCRGHIIAHPNEFAHLHNQHIELNLELWRMIGCPKLYTKWKHYVRSSENFHDDYTPPWIKPRGLPKIINFNREERSRKAFAYSNSRRKLQNEKWRNIEQGDFNFNWGETDFYFSRLQINFTNYLNFYVENNEKLAYKEEMNDYEFDLILSPCSGYSTEVYAQKLNFNGEVAFYDWNPKILQIKKSIVDLNMDKDEILMLNKIYRDIKFVWNSETRQSERFENYGTWDEVRKLQKEMSSNYTVSYQLMDLLEMDYNILSEKVKGKNVFVNTSNIFSYHKVLVKYPLHIIWNSYNNFFKALDTANFWYCIGTNPLKKAVQRIKNENNIN